MDDPISFFGESYTQMHSIARDELEELQQALPPTASKYSSGQTISAISNLPGCCFPSSLPPTVHG